jgi:hypothetical protein
VDAGTYPPPRRALQLLDSDPPWPREFRSFLCGSSPIRREISFL